MRILVTDGMDKTAMAQLRKHGHEVVEQFYEPDQLGEALRGFDVAVVRSKTKVRKEHIDAAKGGQLKLIIRGGVGVDNIDVDYAKANGFFSFLSLCTIIPSLAKVDWAQLPVIGFKAVVIFVAVLIFTFIVFYLTPAWKIVGSKNLSIGIAMCQLIGYPGTELIATEITNAVAQTPEERDAISSKIQTAYVISGFTSVTILSVFIASFLAKLMGA